MTTRIRILTYHSISNYGAALFSYSLQQLLSSHFEYADIKILDHTSLKLASYEFLKLFRPHRNAPLFYIQRYRKFKEFRIDELNLDENSRNLYSKQFEKFLQRERFDLLISAMDVWNITKNSMLPKFPNVYWLPANYQNPAVAFAVSAYRSNRAEIKTVSSKLTKRLSNFSLIGVRDRFTYNLVTDHLVDNYIPVVQIPDPTFLYTSKKTNLRDKFDRIGIDLEKPILGVLLFGKNLLMDTIVKKFSADGYQIVALSMYHQHASFNLGHVLTPHEWAEAFQHLSFCVTDRFHGTIFCLKNNVPFISIEPDPLEETLNSKILDLLLEFNLTSCYVNPFAENFDIKNVLYTIDNIQNNWLDKYSRRIFTKLPQMQDRLHDFCKQIKEILN